MKIHLVLLFLAILFSSISAERDYTGWHLTPDAGKKLDEFSAGGSRCRLKNNRTDFVCRAQLKYTLSKDDYLHRWYDRPLYQDSSLARFCKKGILVSNEEAQALRSALEQGKISGVASLLATS